MMDAHREAFLEEASDLMRELEIALLELEQDPRNKETIGRAFRALHTIKGSGAMFGFDAVAQFTHELETVFEEVRQGRYPATAELIGIALDGRDHIENLLQVREITTELSAASEAILARLRAIVPAKNRDAQPKAEASSKVPKAPESDAPATFRVRFDPDAGLLLTGTNPLLLFRELAQLGDLSVGAHLERIPQLGDFNPEQCYTHWDAVLTTAEPEDAIRDVFIFVDDRAHLEVRRIEESTGSERRRLGEILVDRGDATAGSVEECLSQAPLCGDRLVDAGITTTDRVEAAVLEQQHLERIRDRHGAEPAATLRVPAAKLDSLLNIVGELVTVQARLSGYAVASGEPELAFIAEEVERLTAQLRESTMSARMLPIGETFNRFKRLVRDLSAELGKKVELTTEGNETELDKTVIEQLNDPLVHLIRNAIDHGIEAPQQRVANGKPEKGRIRLAASHSGAFVVLQVSDDGAGMNREAIRARAVRQGLIAADAVLTDQEIFALALAPGFSTADRVTSVSGRGVGMDVVQRSLNTLHGALSITSEPGAGTGITLKIPLTLAIIDGLLVEAGGSLFVIPLANISECIEMEGRSRSLSRDSLVSVRGELVPYVCLRQRFALPGGPPSLEQVIVAETRGGKFGFVVDRVIGNHNTVIKKLGNLCGGIEEVSGATILGDGTVALILDVDKIAAEAIRENATKILRNGGG
jgi:two-component system chemotaxis sensor kinase CheA